MRFSSREWRRTIYHVLRARKQGSPPFLSWKSSLQRSPEWCQSGTKREGHELLVPSTPQRHSAAPWKSGPLRAAKTSPFMNRGFSRRVAGFSLALKTPWVPRPLRTLQRAGATNPCATGFRLRPSVVPAASYPPLQKTQGPRTLTEMAQNKNPPSTARPPAADILEDDTVESRRVRHTQSGAHIRLASTKYSFV